MCTRSRQSRCVGACVKCMSLRRGCLGVHVQASAQLRSLQLVHDNTAEQTTDLWKQYAQLKERWVRAYSSNWNPLTYHTSAPSTGAKANIKNHHMHCRRVCSASTAGSGSSMRCVRYLAQALRWILHEMDSNPSGSIR